MPDLPNRERFEKLLEAALVEAFTRAQRQISRALFRRGMTMRDLQTIDPQVLKPLEAELRTVYADVLADAYIEAAQTFATEAGFYVDESELEERATNWANQYAPQAVDSLIRTTRNQIQDIARRAPDIEIALTLALLLGLIARALSVARAITISRTEITNATSAGEQATQDALTRQGAMVERIWFTQLDERVCFPAWTLVDTDEGQKPIQSLRKDDRVMTRHGYRKVTETFTRVYTGSFTRLQSGKHVVTATSDHEFLLSDETWLEVGKVQPGAVIQARNNQLWHVDCVANFNVSNPNYTPSVLIKKLCLALIFSFILMPIHTINFKRNAKLAQQEINAIASYLNLLLVIIAKRIQRFTGFSFGSCFTIEAPVTSKATKDGIVRGNSSKRFAAILTSAHIRRATALLRAIAPVQMLFSAKRFAAAFALYILSIGCAAFVTAYAISVSIALGDGKGFSAFGTNLSYLMVAVAALCATTVLATLNTGWAQSKENAAFRTLHGIIKALIGAFKRAKDLFSLAWVAKVSVNMRKLLTALGTYCYRHNYTSRILTNIVLLYHFAYTKAIPVYDVSVDEHPEFIANGFVVHNCPICAPRHGRVEGIGWRLPPPAHPRCRCYLGYRITVGNRVRVIFDDDENLIQDTVERIR